MNTLPDPVGLVIFDCDGVLVDSEMIANAVMASVLSDAGLPITAAQCRNRFIGLSLASVRALAEQDLNRPLADDFEQTIQRADAIAFARDLKAVTGIVTALEAIPLPMCIASSGSPEKIARSLCITGLAPYFADRVFSAVQVANGKPAPDLFLLAAQKMATPAACCVVIEDSVQGVIAATRAGMPVLGFAGASHARADPAYAGRLTQAGAWAVFDDMTTLPRLLGI